MTDHYDRQGNPIEFMEWVRLHEDWDYVVVASDKFEIDDEEIHVSTVWLGINHNFMGHGPPIIFETMVFGGPYDEYQWRYTTETEAKAAHVIITEGIVKMTRG